METSVITCPKCGSTDVKNINGTEENTTRPVEPSAFLRAPQKPTLIIIPPDDQLGSE